MKRTLWAIVALIMLVSGCVDEPPERPVVLERPSMTDEDVLAYLAAADTGEMEEGRLAQTKAARQDVQAYGGRMIQEHRSLLSQVMTTAAELKTDLDPAPKSDRLLAEHHARMEGFGKRTGLGFDTAYLEGTIAVHETIIRTVDRAIQEVRHPKLARLLERARTVHQSHLDAARALQRAILTGE